MRRTPRRTLTLLLIVGSLLVLTAAEAGAQGLGYRAGSTQFGKNKVQWRQFDWRIYESPHFRIYYYPEEEQLLEKVVSFAESAYDSLSRAFDYQIADSTTLIFYATHSAFEQNNIIMNFIPEGIGAFASPVRHRMVLPVDMSDPELMALIRHELTHIFQYHILFGSSGGVGSVNPPPTWFMEGMASYMAKDETARDRMFLRDAVVNDAVPPISRVNVQGFFAYRFGHAVFDFIEEGWGQDGFRDFVYEVRNTLGSNPGRALKRVFNVEPEDFDADFRRWLRRRYLPELVATGEPSDFGRRFRTHELRQTQETSPAASPSGDLVAAFSTLRGEVDIVLLDTGERDLVRNLTRGYSSDFEYFVAQELSLARNMGRDLAFSPDGNRIAVFARRGPGRDLVLINALKKGVDRVVRLNNVEQPFAPAWSPDGRTVAFSGFRDGQFDIFLLDLQANTTRNLTNDAIYHGSPTFTPDGKSVIVSSVVGETTKLFRIDLDDPETRYQLTDGEGNDVDAVVGPHGKRVYFTSDRTGAQNIFSLDLVSGQIVQHTNVVTGCFQPTVLSPPNGPQRLVYTGYWKGRFDLYELRLEEPITAPEVVVEGSGEGFTPQPVTGGELPRFEPPIEVALDDANKSEYKRGKFFLEDAGATAGYTADQILLGYTYLIFSDQLGDRRIIGLLSSVESFQDIDLIYANSRRRWQWNVHLFDNRRFFVFRDLNDPLGQIDRQAVFEQTGVIGTVAYPFNLYHRFEVGTGYMRRTLFRPQSFIDPETGQEFFAFVREEGDFPVAQMGFVGDSAIGAAWGPVAGRRWSIQAQYAPDTDDSGTLFRDLRLDLRQYVPLTLRSNVALRVYGAMSDGNAPNIYYFGGLNDFRGVPFNSFNGDRAFFANVELRFPLIDRFATPILDFQGIRGRVFLDVGGTWYDFLGQDFDFWDDEESRLADGRAAYGFGFTVRFLGIDWNWDFAKQWDGKESLSDYETSFWIGWQF